jgi:quinol-cytochrome oxidoreductase complex cytochrome b subunit
LKLLVQLNNVTEKNIQSMRFINQPSIVNAIPNHLMDYPTSSNTNYLWSFGSLSGMMLSLQIITGILLAMHYTPHTAFAFNSV